MACKYYLSTKIAVILRYGKGVAMKLDAVLKLKELKDFFDENQITVKKDRIGFSG